MRGRTRTARRSSRRLELPQFGAGQRVTLDEAPTASVEPIRSPGIAPLTSIGLCQTSSVHGDLEALICCLVDVAEVAWVNPDRRRGRDFPGRPEHDSDSGMRLTFSFQCPFCYSQGVGVKPGLERWFCRWDDHEACLRNDICRVHALHHEYYYHRRALRRKTSSSSSSSSSIRSVDSYSGRCQPSWTIFAIALAAATPR